jgi:regulatory Fis family protein
MPRFTPKVTNEQVQAVADRIAAGELTKQAAADELGVNYTTLWRRMKTLAVDRPADPAPRRKPKRSRQQERERKASAHARPEHRPIRSQPRDPGPVRAEPSTGRVISLGGPSRELRAIIEEHSGRLTARQKDRNGRTIRTSLIDPSLRDFYEERGYVVT